MSPAGTVAGTARPGEVILSIPPPPEEPNAITDALSHEPKSLTSAKLAATVSKRPRQQLPSGHDAALFRRCSIAKPKSRFVEPPVPLQPTTAASDPEDEDEEIGKKFQLATDKSRKCSFLTILEWGVLILSMGCLITSLSVRSIRRTPFWGLKIWQWCLMVSVICCGRLVTQWFMNAIVFFIERNFLLRKKVLYFVYGLRRSVQACIWLGLVLLSWFLLFEQSSTKRSAATARALDLVSRFLASMLIGSVIWLLKTLLMKIIASQFHVNVFFDRIQESIFHQYVLHKLSAQPTADLALKVMSPNKWNFTGSTKRIFGNGREEIGPVDATKLHRMSQETVSTWTMKGLINVIRSSGLSTLSNVIEDFQVGNEEKEINSEVEAKAAAIRIFSNVAKHGQKYIDEEDLLRFLRKEEIDSVLSLFEGAFETRKIKKSALKSWVVKAYTDRKSLAHSLNDTKTAVRQLHKLVTMIVIVLILIITLLLMGIATLKVLVVLSSQLLVIVFIFGNSCKTVFEAIIFVFVMHPFDVGDRCVVDGTQMVVEEMNILTTVFLRVDNEKIYYPNSILASKPISNIYRSPNMKEIVEFAIDMSTSVEILGTLKSKIKAYIDSKPNHWAPTHSLNVKDIVDGSKLKISLIAQSTINFQNLAERNSRRSDIVLELKKIFEELSIAYQLLPQNVQLSYAGSSPLPVVIGQNFM